MKKVIILDIRNEESLSIFNDIDDKLKHEVSFLQNNIILTPEQYAKILDKLGDIKKIILEECQTEVYPDDLHSS